MLSLYRTGLAGHTVPVSWSEDGDSHGPGLEYGAPDPEELGRTLPGSFVLMRTDRIAVVVRAVRVYSTGCVLSIEWVRRRLDEDGATWSEVQRVDTDTFLDYMYGPDGLTLGVHPADQARVTVTGGGGMYARDRHVTGTQEYWLSPIPSGPSAELTGSWLGQKVSEGKHALDLPAIRDIASTIEHVWPKTAPTHRRRWP